ncbi:MAG: hypothetical protein CMN73_00875, partial [Sphingomonas sp.]|nr:hypothetical protein [Sphingomonas sp.]
MMIKAPVKMTRTLRISLLLGSALAPFAAHAQSLPAGGTVVRGSAEISASGNAMTITQNSDRAIINWQDFSIARDGSVDVRAPDANSVLLNRVTGDATSVIAGRLSANGQVYLVNPNGIFITETGSVKAGGFVASTLDIGDDAFMQGGALSFAGTGGSVVNAGEISIVRGGYAALMGGEVDNRGLILAPYGKVAMAGGDRATLDFGGDGFLQVALSEGSSASLTNSGSISARGGAVILSGGQAREAARNTVNLDEVDAATSVTRSGSSVVLGGSISATDGGRVTVTGSDIVLESATIDVSGAAGGGAVRIGGDWHGEGTLSRAMTVSVDAASTIRANAIEHGDGGDVVLWSDGRTDFAGTISARGAGSGNGGDAEVSSKGVLDYRGATDLRGTAFGTLLLDPRNITISTDADSGAAGFTANADDSVINVNTLMNALKTANITVSTGATGTQAGNITVAAPITWSTNARLTLQAAGDIDINGAITAHAGTLDIKAGGTSGGTGAIDVARFVNSAGDWRQVGPSIASFHAADFRVNGGTFMRALGGDGSVATPYRLTDIYGFQGIAGFATGNFTLANNIDANGTATWNDGSGFKRIDYGYDANRDDIPFSGSIDGTGHSITGLRQNGNGSGIFKLFGGSLSNLVLSGYDINETSYYGGAFAYQLLDADVSNVHLDGSLRVRSYAGGFAFKVQNSRLDGISVTGTVQTGGGWAAGLIYSVADSTISNFYVNTDVTSQWAAGLVFNLDGIGSNQTSVLSNGYVTGSTASRWKYLVADNYGTIESTVYYNKAAYGSGPGTGLTAAQLRDASNFTGFDFNNTWYQAGDMLPILRGEAAPVAADGVYEITTLKQLALVAANPSGNYRLAADIDASATAGTAPHGVWGPMGWAPIAGLTGSFDGQLHAIDGLTMNNSSASGGLFATIDGSVRNLRLTNVDLTGGSTVAALAGSTGSGEVRNIWVDGAVRGSGPTTSGVVGLVFGDLSNVHFSGTVSGGQFVGGLVGTLYGHLDASSFEGSVTTTVGGSDQAGGLAVSTSSGSSISNSYASGTINSPGTFGGLVATNSGRIETSWAAMGSSSYGAGIAAINRGQIWSSVFWDKDLSRSSSGVYFNYGTFSAVGLTTAQARSASSYAGFDFTDAWYQSGDLRPILRSEMVTVDGVGQIFNVRQLQLMDANRAGSYAMIADVDASATAGTDAAGIWSAGGFIAIADTAAYSDSGFSGTFDGKGRAITGFNQGASNVAGFGRQAMFSAVSGTIQNVSIAGNIVSDKDSTSALVGLLYNEGTVRNVLSTVTVASTNTGINSNASGLIGTANGLVEDSRFVGTVTGRNVGGLFGSINGTVRRSSASGTLRADQDSGTVGGLAAYSYGGATISDIYIDTNNYTSGGFSEGPGMLFGRSINNMTVTNVFLNGTVNDGAGNKIIGAGNGKVFGSIIFNNEKLVTSSTGLAPNARGYTTAQLQDLSTVDTVYAGFDFRNVWFAPNQSGQGGDSTAHFAQLRSLNDVVVVGADGLFRTYGDGNSQFVTDYSGLGANTYVLNPGAVTSAADATSNVGSYAGTISGTTTTGTPRKLYLADTLSVTPRALIVSAAAVSRLYGEANPALTYTVGGRGLANGDTLSGALDTGATATSNVGTYGITQGTLGAGSNYTLAFTGANLTVTPRALNVTADALSRLYGEANPALTYTVGGDGLVNG